MKSFRQSKVFQNANLPVDINSKIICRGHCKMLELQINKVVDPAFYTDHDKLCLSLLNIHIAKHATFTDRAFSL